MIDPCWRPKSIFIVEVGRSGTNYLAKIVNAYANIHDPWSGKENHWIREKITTAALLGEPLGKEVEDYFRTHIENLAEGQIFLDQCHLL